MSGDYASGTIGRATRRRVYPHPADLFGRDRLSCIADFARTPWWIPGVFRDESLIGEYVSADELPDKIPVAALRTDDWARRIAVPNHVIFRGFDRRSTCLSVTASREAFVKLVYQRFHRTRESRSIIPANLGLNVCQYRTYGEGLSGPTLVAILAMRED